MGFFLFLLAVAVLLVLVITPLYVWTTMRSRISELTSRIAELEREMERLWARQPPMPAQPSPIQRQPEPVPEPIPDPPITASAAPPPIPTPDIPLPAFDIAPPAFDPAPPAFDPAPPALQPTGRERLRASLGGDEWETLVGGSLLNKIGALVLVVGIALFLGYSFTRMGPAGRATTSLAVSLSLLAAGIVLERRHTYRVFARGLIGAGWAALYATAYAAYALPAARVIENPLAGSILLLIVGLAMIAHSLHYRVQSISAVAYAAAFAALAATPSTPFAVVSLIPLAASLLYLAYRFEWNGMALFGLAATYGTCFSRGDSGTTLFATQSLLLVYWILFEAFDLLRVHRRNSSQGVGLMFPLNALAFLGLSNLAWEAKAPGDLWLLSALAAALYLASSLVRFAIRGPSTFASGDTLAVRLAAGSFEGSSTISALLCGLAIAGRLVGVWRIASIAVEAEVLYVTGVFLGLSFLRGLGGAAFAYSLSRILFEEIPGASQMVVADHLMYIWSPAAVFHAALFYLNRLIRRPNVIYSCVAAAMVLIVSGAELPHRAIGVGWLVFAAVLFEIGARRRLPEFRYQAYAVGLLGVAAGLIYDGRGDDRGACAALAIGVCVAYAGCLRLRLLSEDIIPAGERRLAEWAATLGTVLLSLALVKVVVPDSYLGLAFWGLAVLLLELGLRGLPRQLLEASYAVSVLASLAVFAADADNYVTLPPPAIWLSYSGAALGAFYCWLRLRGRQPIPSAAHSLAGTFLLAALCYREFPGGLLTISWGVEGLALLGAGFPLRERAFRLQGLGLFFICILKLFLYDLRNLETLYRILSFVALGVILLAVSWIYTRYRDHIRRLLT